MKADTDRDVLQRIADGDALALRVLHTRHATPLYRFLVGLMKSEMQAEEVVNETFLDIWRKADTFRGDANANVRTWLFAIGRNRALSRMRKKQDAPLDEGVAEAIPDAADPAVVALAKLEKAEKLRGCIQLLKPAMREVIDLVYYQEMSVSEVADVLGIPEGTVKTRLFHARKAMSELFRRAGIDRGWP